MPKAGGNRRSSNDFWAEKAKVEGYPARSVYKLEEILAKSGGIKSDSLVLDLGAAPGSWSFYLVRKHQARVVACDLKPLDSKVLANKQIDFIKGDFLREDVSAKIASYGAYDAVVCDAAPATTGDRLVDSARSYRLVEQALGLALAHLVEGGLFIAKIFAGGDEQELIEQAKLHFVDVKTMRPKAVRKESFELYLVASKFNKS
ncbi:SAM-dependent methyltransferase [Entomospira culicis]|uniref:Ribosomal RNA large subunit methyltransferase E n=1 Tax=Entomospira culicis TaxID=2719989 RepID=A0A968GE10_9SPIO|nr:RlmE family RNA methyltransferase [Entomospira culicis]NIZ18614.1 RlmE family RNA methyltransferase [Entomospira culicis]NIZ68829.1 RlmE family RNA methyltransferase [Entomospira culicis]WDI37423.1 RlmE family RNA methyltransferase [Entomospira culicis]WDI39051.1 RlmE family RNA methyltransferase [Entomospira culicis]